MGKPVSFLKKGTNKPMTVAVRMTRLENMESKNYIVLIILFLLSIYRLFILMRKLMTFTKFCCC